MPEGEAIKILTTPPPSLSAGVFKNLQVNQAAALLKEVPKDTFREIVKHLDPAQPSSIILTTVTDVIGFFAFLGFAVIFQNLLI